MIPVNHHVARSIDEGNPVEPKADGLVDRQSYVIEENWEEHAVDEGSRQHILGAALWEPGDQAHLEAIMNFLHGLLEVNPLAGDLIKNPRLLLVQEKPQFLFERVDLANQAVNLFVHKVSKAGLPCMRDHGRGCVHGLLDCGSSGQGRGDSYRRWDLGLQSLMKGVREHGPIGS